MPSVKTKEEVRYFIEKLLDNYTNSVKEFTNKKAEAKVVLEVGQTNSEMG